MTAVVNWICSKFQRDGNENCIIPIKKKINNLCAYANQKWAANFRNWSKLEKWLSCETKLKLINSNVPTTKGLSYRFQVRKWQILNTEDKI